MQYPLVELLQGAMSERWFYGLGAVVMFVFAVSDLLRSRFMNAIIALTVVLLLMLCFLARN